MIPLQKYRGIPSCKGNYISKSGEIFRYDSMTELATMMILDRNEKQWKKNTKIRIPYVFENKNRKYIPDFLVLPNLIIEIKGSNDKPEIEAKCKAAVEFCKKLGLVYAFIPYDVIRNDINWNLVKEYHSKNKI